MKSCEGKVQVLAGVGQAMYFTSQSRKDLVVMKVAMLGRSRCRPEGRYIHTPEPCSGCRTEGSFSWESIFTFIWVDNSTLSIDEDYSITNVNTPSL